jgi:hypothetical protein
MDRKEKKDLFGRVANKTTESRIFGKNGELKEIFKPKVIKYNALEKPMIKIKDMKDKFL